MLQTAREAGNKEGVVMLLDRGTVGFNAMEGV